jgi:hypothetical protein
LDELRDHFRRQADLLRARAGVAAGTGHAPTTGRLREDVVKDFLREHLPPYFTFRSGVVIDSTGARSGQQDYVLVDTRFPLNDIGGESDSLLLAESVVATIEVKSYLDKTQLLDALEKCGAVQMLKRSGQHVYRKGGMEIGIPEPWPILTYIFAFDGSGLDTLLRHVPESPAAARGHFPETVCVLNKGVIVKSHQRPRVIGHEVKLPPADGGAKISQQRYARDALFAFYRRLLDDVMPLRLELIDIDRYYESRLE